ncbi:hypothetical protein [Chryseobacterium sp.]|uniref:hypothetical protein n=1 Tax=Chryseobacterium sp. TaxID=1871047 RepID=UPI0012C44BE7|nr:hypothetical protein [Chryseobacterium sp.]MPS65537.1 hypothetical protein [Chryseobacterium sp.]
MFFGTFDYIILTVIFLFNIGVWKFKIIKKRNWILYLITFLVFGFLIPGFSIHFEVQKVIKNQPFVDNFTLLYTYFRFPVWWLIGVIEAFILRNLITKRKL